MPVRQVEHKGMTIKAAAFEVIGLGRFLPSLSIERARAAPAHAKLFDPVCPPDLFGSAEEALSRTIAFGKAIVDGDIPGLTVSDL